MKYFSTRGVTDNFLILEGRLVGYYIMFVRLVPLI